MENLHHLRAPITMVRGYWMMMREERFGPITEEQREVGDKLLDTVNALSAWMDTFVTM
jgi:hypothetical protein